MLVVYDQKGSIQYTVDDPYPKELYDTYVKQSETDPSFRFMTVPDQSISGKYVDDDEGLIDRPQMSLSLPGGTSVNVPLDVSGLPEGSEIFVDDQFVAVSEEGTVQVIFEDAGEYSVRIKCWPFLDHTQLVEVVDDVPGEIE